MCIYYAENVVKAYILRFWDRVMEFKNVSSEVSGDGHVCLV